FQSLALKSFRIKILLDDLSAPHILYKRNPDYSNTCYICHNVSDILYWAICPTSDPLF
ncbi:20365_t:CDS:1, partial [Gigaspora margarita]